MVKINSSLFFSFGICWISAEETGLSRFRNRTSRMRSLSLGNKIISEQLKSWLYRSKRQDFFVTRQEVSNRFPHVWSGFVRLKLSSAQLPIFWAHSVSSQVFNWNSKTADEDYIPVPLTIFSEVTRLFSSII